MNYLIAFTLLVLTSVLFPGRGQAQRFIEDITDFFEFDLGAARAGDSTHFVPKIVIAPVATYEPTTSLGLGVGAKLLFKFRGAGPETRTSNLPLSVTYTLKNQFLFYSGYTVFFNRERYLLKGNLIFSEYPFPYYGIGAASREETVTPITFNNLLFEPLLLKRIAPDLFAGGGIRYNRIYNTRLTEDVGDQPAGTPRQTELGSTSAGLELAVTYDSRDNVLNARRGDFLEFTHGFYDRVLGGTHRFMLSKLDYRRYFPLSSRSADVIALELYTSLAWGDTPPLELSALGGYTLLRGYPEGRFRDRGAFFAQAEYRWQTFKSLGLVFFGGVGEVYRRGADLRFDQLKYSLGTGLRVKIVPAENLNIRLDYALGFGPERDNNFYLSIAEAF